MARGGGGQNRAFARTANVKLSPIKAMELAASRVPDVVSLAQGIPSFDTPEPIKAFVQQKIAEGACATYSLTPGLPQLRECIAESLLREGMHYDPDQEIIVSSGSIEALAATLLALTQPGDEIILSSPSYASYQEVVRIAGCTPRFAPLREEQNFAFDEEAFESCLSPHTRAILYCNPNNPTGTVFSEAETRALIALAERHDLFLIIDEAYKDFVYTPEAYFSPAQVADVRQHIVRIFTFSKAYGMTGWRVGYLHSDARNVQEILKVHDALVTCAPVVSQYAALAALEYGQEHITAFRQAFKQRRDLTLTHLDRLSHVFDYQKPEGAYFVFPRLKDVVAHARDSHALAYDILEKAKVAVVPGIAFGPSGEAHIRLNFGRRPDDITTAFERLSAYFSPAATRRVQLTQHRASRPVESIESVESVGSIGSIGSIGSVGSVGSIESIESDPKGPKGPYSYQLLRRFAVLTLQTLARLRLWRRNPRVIAIAGSHGKTVIKRIVTELLAQRYRVQPNPRSYNTDIGLPLAILNIELASVRLRDLVRGFVRAVWTALFNTEAPDILVLEFGVRHRGDMQQLVRTVTPDIAILTTLTPSYSTDVEELHTLQDEMRALCLAAGASCQFVIDGDDPLLQDVIASLPTPPLLLHRSAWRAEKSGLQLQSPVRCYPVTREIIGENERFSVQAAVAVAECWTSLSPAEIQRFLSENTTVH